MDRESREMVKNLLLIIFIGGALAAMVMYAWALLTIDDVVNRHLMHLAKLRG